MSSSLWLHGPQHTRPPRPSPTPGACSNLCPSSQRRHPTLLSSVVPFSSRLQSFPASGSFQISQLFALCGWSIGVSASASALPMNTQGWSPLGRTGWISLQSKGLSRVFSNTTVQKHQFKRQRRHRREGVYVLQLRPNTAKLIHIKIDLNTEQSSRGDDPLRLWNLCWRCHSVPSVALPPPALLPPNPLPPPPHLPQMG